MRKNYTRLYQLLCALFFPLLLVAQETQDYTIRLHSGNFIPAENISTLNKQLPVLTESLFDNKYYVVIQFRTLPTQAQKDQLKNAGIILVDYIPNNAYTASISSGTDLSVLSSLPVRSVFRFQSDQKTVPALLTGYVPAHAVKQSGYADLSVITYEKMDIAKISSALNNIGASVVEDMPMFRTFVIRIPQTTMSQLVDLPFVQWVEYIEAPNKVENILGRTLHRANILNDGVRNLKGDGLNVGIWDENEVSPHLDFSPTGRLNIMEPTGNTSSHSTHCAGTIAGRGLIDPRARGMAPNAALYSYNFNGNIQTEMANAIPGNNLVVSSHSYGSTQTCGLNGAGVVYNTTARNTDLNLNTFPFHLHVHSAGNSQSACAGGWSTITSSGKPAKNNIVVANVTTLEGLSGTSSCGPVQDGRIKPEISAMGTSVFSTYTPLNAYGTISGTSMATPGIAGSVTLLVQRYRQLNGNVNPPSTLIKNTICNTANDLGNAGPDYRFGFGRINALQAVKILEENRYALNSMSTAGINDVSIAVPAGASRLRVMLTWNDPAAAANANPALVNNLDLRVIDAASTTTLPWILDPNTPANPATRGVDNYSNIEQVTLDNPSAGNYTLRVLGTSIPTGPQDYALTWSVEMPYIEVLYPNGAESFNPGSSETITWDNSGVTGNQTVEYSLNNGGSWTLISSSVAAATTRLQWTVPAGANTSTALIRVTSGALTDVSDANFKILGTTGGFAGNGVSCNPGEVNFTWNAVTNATHYDIYSLNAAGAFTLLASNLTGTSYTATGLTPNTSMWFAIRAKNNTTGAESERSNAINVTVSNGGSGMGVVGGITGQSSVCGATTVPYSIAPVSGATSYTWAAPPGATIVSGQGSTSITVSYPGGSGNGNVSVFASNGSCNTAPSNLAVNVGPAVSAPVSGGNQTQTVCPSDPMPTLTATATVPAGHTVVWYNAATAGTVVASPTLSAVGTVTYYASSSNTASGCESNTRTAVTLTINAVTQATASAGGPTTFCQGGNVVLTASAGSSYLWSNGATTQAITVTATGSYTATVNNNGCTTTSAAINVTVNPLPAANITAGGPTAFCQGDNVVLTASAGASYLWSNGATTQAITVTNTGNYSVTVTSAAGCSAASASTSIAVSNNPVVNITASPYTRLYPGLVTTLTANVTPPGTYNYTWYKNNVVVPGATSATLTGIDLDDLGNYTVTVTNTSGLPCSNTSPVLAIADSAITKLFILPNPNNGSFAVVYHSSVATTYTLNIYDAKGALVFKRAYAIGAPYQRMDVDIRKHGRGTYHILLSGSNGKRLAAGTAVVAN